MLRLTIDSRTAMTQIDRVHATSAFTHMKGHRIIVQLAPRDPAPAAGESGGALQHGVAFGESILVIEVGRLPVSDRERFAIAVRIRCDRYAS